MDYQHKPTICAPKAKTAMIVAKFMYVRDVGTGGTRGEPTLPVFEDTGPEFILNFASLHDS